MRILIDGYNLMHAVVLTAGHRLGPDGLRKRRRRFLNDLAERLGPDEASQTTIVFDASQAPAGLSHEGLHKGMTVLFAAQGEEADERIEHLIAHHPAPKGLTVVSSDHRIRLAAKRRRASVKTADEFWSELEDRRRRKSRRPFASRPAPTPAPTSAPAPEPERPDAPGAAEAAYWLEQFRHVAESLEAHEVFRHVDFVPTDEEVAQIAREVDEEFRRH